MPTGIALVAVVVGGILYTTVKPVAQAVRKAAHKTACVVTAGRAKRCQANGDSNAPAPQR